MRIPKVNDVEIDVNQSVEQTFEELRQEQETRNERVINLIQMVHFALVFIANLGTLFFPLAPYRASMGLLVLLGGSFLVRVGIALYFRTAPPYRYTRKYVLTGLDLGVFAISPLMLGWQGAYPWLFLGPFAVCIFAMLIVLSGLRYDTGVLWFNGLATMLIHVSIFPWLVERPFQLPVLVVGALTLGCITVVTAYASESLLRVYRDSTQKEQLARFLAPELVEQVMRNPKLLERKTERRQATVLFADIRGFTTISEAIQPERTVELLNEFLEEMTVAIMEHQGMVDKYIGDSVMGVFGVPVFREDHALRATRAALDMRQRLTRLNKKLVAQGLPELSIGIGIHTGELLIGVIGSTKRFDFTVIGDTVNVASRIEGMTRSYPVEILVSDSTYQQIKEQIPLYSIATVTVRNRSQQVQIWSPFPLSETPTQPVELG